MPMTTAPPATRPVAPTDFRYWDGARSPSVRRMRAVAEAVLGFDPCPPDDVAQDLIADLYAGDPTAEAFVDEVFGGPGGRGAGRKLLDRAMAEGIDAIDDAPDAMRALFHEFEQVPDWVDPQLVEEGARIWRRWGTDLFAVAGSGTLEMYTESAVATPLSLAGGYAGDNALRRFLETTRFWMDVSEPGALLTPGSAGRTTAMLVRVMHVSVRRRVEGHAEWSTERWGLPISQAYMMLTLMGGSVGPALAMWPMGWITTPKEMRALLHFQRYLGHLLGVQPRYYPEDIKGAIQVVFAAAVSRSHTAGPGGVELIESFPRAFAPKPGTRGLQRLKAEYEYRRICAYVGAMMAPATRRRHDLPPAMPWLLYLLARTPLLATRELLRRVLPPLDALLERRAVARREAWYAQQMDGRKAAFDAGSGLRR